MNKKTYHILASVLFSGSILLLLVMYPLSTVLPVWWGFENQPIENAQAALLLASAVCALVFYRSSNRTKAWFGLAVMPVILLMIGRELSWGAVFLEPNGMGEHGPIFSSHDLWYKPAVGPIAVVFILFSAGMIAAKRVFNADCRLLGFDRFPFWSISVTIVAMAISTAIEGNIPLFPASILPADRAGLLLEETSELCAYMAMVAALLFVFAEIDHVDDDVKADHEYA